MSKEQQAAAAAAAAVPQAAEAAEPTIDFKHIKETALCNWCHNPMSLSDGEVSEANLVDTGLTFSDGSKASALYCSTCIKDEKRKSEPKSAMNLKTLQEVDVQALREAAEAKAKTTAAAKEQQQTTEDADA